MFPPDLDEEELLPGFRALEFLGRGDRGAVWSVLDAEGRPFCVKLLPCPVGKSPADWQVFLDAMALRHPHLIAHHAVHLRSPEGETSEIRAGVDVPIRELTARWQLVLLTDLAERSLEAELELSDEARRDPRYREELGDRLTQAADALDFLHARTAGGRGPLVHGSFKPQNLLLKAGQVALAGHVQASFLRDCCTGSLSRRISPAYQAPEILSGGAYTPAADIYALAICWTELRSGRLPFEQTSFAAVVEAQLRHRLDFSGFGEAEQRLLHQATAVDPTVRPTKASELVQALRSASRVRDSRPPRSVRSPLEEFDTFTLRIPELNGRTVERSIAAYGIDAGWLLKPAKPGEERSRLTVRDLGHTRGGLDVQALETFRKRNHPGICRLPDFWILDEQLRRLEHRARDASLLDAARYLVLLEEGPARTLADEMRDAPAAGIDTKRLLRWVRSLADALDRLNAPSGPDGCPAVQHRQVHPESIFIDEQDEVRLGNPGYAKLMHGTQAMIPQGVRGLLHPYIAPEIVSGHLSRWSDCFSLAVLFHELRTGFLPFEDEAHDTLTFCKRLRESQLNLKRLPRREAEVIARGTSAVPEERFPSAAELAARLIEAVEAIDVPSEPASQAGPGSETRRSAGRSTWESVKQLFLRQSLPPAD